MAQERLRTEHDALVIRVTQLERERSALALEHAERVTALDALVRRLSARVQRAEKLQGGVAESGGPHAHAAKPIVEPADPAASSVLEFRRTMRGY